MDVALMMRGAPRVRNSAAGELISLMGKGAFLGYGWSFGDEMERFDMSSAAWSCPHDLDGVCQRVQGAVCEPGMRGCVLEGKVRFAREEMNLPRKPVKAKAAPAEKKPAQPARRRLPF